MPTWFRRLAPPIASVSAQTAVCGILFTVPDEKRAELPLPAAFALNWAVGITAFRAAAGFAPLTVRTALWYGVWCGPVGVSLSAGLAAVGASYMLQPTSPLPEAAQARFETCLAAQPLQHFSGQSAMAPAVIARMWYDAVQPLFVAGDDALTEASVLASENCSGEWGPLVAAFQKHPGFLRVAIEAARDLASGAMDEESGPALSFEALAHALVDLEAASDAVKPSALRLAWALLRAAPVAKPTPAQIATAATNPAFPPGSAKAAAPNKATQRKQASPAAVPWHVPAPAFAGSRPGYAFRMGTAGLGYYLDPAQPKPNYFEPLRLVEDAASARTVAPTVPADVVSVEQVAWWVAQTLPYGAFDEASLVVERGWFGERVRRSKDSLEIARVLLGGHAAVSRTASPSRAVKLALELNSNVTLALSNALQQPASSLTPSAVAHARLQKRIKDSFTAGGPAPPPKTEPS